MNYGKTNVTYLLLYLLCVLAASYFMFRPSGISGTSPKLKNEIEEDTTYRLSMLFAGDIMAHSPQLDAAYDATTKQYSFENSFRFVKPLISNYDIAIANLETTLGGEPYSGYPQFCTPDNMALALKNAGFDILATSNNHSVDRGAKGIQRTIDIIEHNGMEHVGTYKDTTNREGEHPLIFTRNNIKIALLNYTYGTNGIKVPKPYIVNQIDTAAIRKDLEKAKYYKPDFTIIFFHWGNEYQRTPSPEQKMVAQFSFEKGADLIIGAHPHVIQPIEEIEYKRDGKKRKGVVYWSLGNYISNQRNPYQDGGIMAHIELEKDSRTKETKLVNHMYIPAWVNKNSRTTQKDYFVLPVSMHEQDTTIFEVNKAENYKFKQFGADTRTHLAKAKELKYPTVWRTDTASFNKIKAVYKVEALTTDEDFDPQTLIANQGMSNDTLVKLCACTPQFLKEPAGNGQFRYYFTALPTIENARKIARKLREYGLDKSQLTIEYK